MKSNVITPTRKPYSKPETLLKLYRWMERYETENQCKPSVEDVSEEFSLSTSVVRYYQDRMVELKMGYQPRVIRPKTGQEITPPRSYVLLPLTQALEPIKSHLKENQ